jgi:hypothetical protein
MFMGRAVYITGVLALLIIFSFEPGCKNKVTNHLPAPPDTLLFSTNWEWTRDSRGGGSQASISFQGDTIVIAPVIHVHFINRDTIIGGGIYAFKFKGYYFKFAWKISPQDSLQGTGLIFQKDSGDSLALIHVKWDSFFYGWHNSGDQFRNVINFPFDSTAWHTVTVFNSSTNIVITFDGDTLDFFSGQLIPVDSFLVDAVPGYVGIGNSFSSEVKFLDLMYIR